MSDLRERLAAVDEQHDPATVRTSGVVRWQCHCGAGRVVEYSSHVPPDGEGWERNVDAGIPGEGWERFDYHEESYWRRAKGHQP